MNYQGDYFEDSTVCVDFTTNDAAGGAVAPSAPFTAADVKIYKDGSIIPKATTNGVAVLSPFAGVVGQHQVAINTSINTGDVGFWVKGSDYKVTLEPTPTVDGQTVTAIPATFSIENRNQRGTNDAALAANTALEATSQEILDQVVGTGNRTIIINVKDQDTNNLQDVLVRIGTISRYTDPAGNAVFALDDGDYDVILRKDFVLFTVPEPLTVDGDDTHPYSGELIVIPAPVDVNVCRVFEYLFLPDSTDNPETVSAKAEIVLLPYDKDSKLHSGVVIDGIYNSNTGLVFWDIVRGATVRFKVGDFINVVRVVPDQSTARLSEISV